MSVTSTVRRITAPRTCAVVVLLALALSGLVLLAAPVAAHAVLTGTQPQRGATVTDHLDLVVLEFSEPVAFAQVQVTGPDGTRVEEGTPVERGETVEQPLSSPLEPGTYTVAFRTTSDDGHPIEDTFEFAYKGPVTTGVAGDGGDDESETDLREEDEDVDAAGPDADSEEAGDVDLGVPVLVLAVLVLVGFAAAALWAVRRRSDDEEVSVGSRPGAGNRGGGTP